MKITKKYLLLPAIIILIGIQPTIRNQAYYYNEPTFTEKLWHNISEFAAPLLSAAIGAYIAAKIMKYALQENIPHRPATKTISFKDYIGIPQTAITLVDQLKHPEKYKSMGISIPHGILLTGDPGTGKTYLAQAIAGEVGCPFFEYSATDFQAKFVGESEKNIRNAFQNARNAAKKAGKNIAIIFIDEFDTIGKRSGTAESNAEIIQKNLINTFLTEMSGFERNQILVIVIGATNFPENIDPALRRPGRFDFIIHISYPNKEARMKLLKLAAQNKPISPNISFDNIANATEGMSQADIKLLFDLAGNIALQHNNIERDYDSFVKAIWQIKEKNHMLQIASRENRKNIIDAYLQRLQITKFSTEDLINQTTNMTKTDIQEIFEKAYNFSLEHPEKTLIDWLWIAIEAKKQQMKIRKNKEAFELCKKMYAPHTIEEHTQAELLDLEPNDIFNEFNLSYK